MDGAFNAITTPANARVVRGFAFWTAPDREMGGWVYVRRIKTGHTQRLRYEFRSEQDGLIKGALREAFADVEKRRFKIRAARRLRAEVVHRREEVAARHRLRMISGGLAPSTIERTAAHGVLGGSERHLSHCWNCRAKVDASIDVRCVSCRWVVCYECLACLDTRVHLHQRFAGRPAPSQAIALIHKVPVAENSGYGMEVLLPIAAPGSPRASPEPLLLDPLTESLDPKFKFAAWVIGLVVLWWVWGNFFSSCQGAFESGEDSCNSKYNGKCRYLSSKYKPYMCFVGGSWISGGNFRYYGRGGIED